ASFVAGAVARLAAAATISLYFVCLVGRETYLDQPLDRHMHIFFTVLADRADKPLCLDEVDGCRNQERLDTHVDQSRDRRRRVICVKRREHQMARQRSLDGDLGRLKVTDLTDEDDVRILTQE